MLAAALACGGLAIGTASAEDTKGKWQFGFGLSYYATTDYIRSNSDIAVASSTAGEESGLPSVQSVDERPDENMLNEPSVRDDFRFDVNVSYGLTRWLALELAAGYMNSAVGNFEFFSEDRDTSYQPPSQVFRQSGDETLCGPDGNQICFFYGTNNPGSNRTNLFVPVGDITEIPLMLSALVRFRPESPLDPYIGLGMGYIFTNLTHGAEFEAKSKEVGELRVRVASEGEWTDSTRADKTSPDPGFQPVPIEATVNDGFEYHVAAGIDYYISDKISMYVDARYVWADTSVDITIDDAHQVRFGIADQGKLVKFQNGSAAAPNFWEDNGFVGCPGGCANDGLFATEDSNGNGSVDQSAQYNEGNGILYLFPAGPNPDDPNGLWTDPQKAVMVVDCPACVNGTFLDSEDQNFNRIMDRWLLWGGDICTPIPGQVGVPSICRPEDISQQAHYVWPAGCSLSPPNPGTPTRLPEGCPTPPGSDFSVSLSGVDDQSDMVLIQGGEIKLGGFSIGVGMKFTF
jgi:outer membrane protein W